MTKNTQTKTGYWIDFAGSLQHAPKWLAKVAGALGLATGQRVVYTDEEFGDLVHELGDGDR